MQASRSGSRPGWGSPRRWSCGSASRVAGERLLHARRERSDHGSCGRGSAPSPPAALLEREERLQIRRGAGADLVERGAGEGEVEQLEAEFVVLAVFRNADVVGLEIAVRDALLLQKLQRFE